jgi:hypothetical protein
MKILFLCLLMTSILIAAYYGPATAPALRRLIKR